MNKILVIMDLQFGSTGKGQVAGTVGRTWQPDTAVCANGPNAGHTYKWLEPTAHGSTPSQLAHITRSVMHTVMPIGAVLPTVNNILIGPGAVIDLDRLAMEIQQSAPLLIGKTLIIHPNASVVLPEHRAAESSLVAIGSTMKGTSEAMIAKIRRRIEDAPLVRYYGAEIGDKINTACHMAGLRWWHEEGQYNEIIDRSEKLLVEGAQGHSLSIHSRFYPHCTSRDVSLAQVLADCRLPFPRATRDLAVIGVARTYPIRVANRFAPDGKQIGYSGDCYPDQRELSWEDLGRPPELTTVTRLPRRIFTFSYQQIAEAVRYSSPTVIALTFCDYIEREQHRREDGFVEKAIGDFADRVEKAAGGVDVGLLSYGPADDQMFSPTYNGPDDQRLGLGPVFDIHRWLP